MEKLRLGELSDLSVLLKDLITSYNKMLGIVDNLNGITKQTKMLSFNSSIEAARAGEAGKGFQVISKHMQSLAEQSENANHTSLVTIGEMNKKIHDVVGVRTADIAYDVMDKIDRQLFERNCDTQIWATFDSVVEFLMNPTEENQGVVNNLLKHIVDLNVVYQDILLADINGKVVAAAVRREDIGEDVSDRRWYYPVKETKQVSASDMYYSRTCGEYSMAYSSPVLSSSGEMVGILSTRYDWNYIYDIVDHAKVSDKGEIYVINKEGKVIASKNRDEILEKDLSDTEAAKQLNINKEYGYLLEEDQKGNILSATGFARSRGYSTYSGKEWSVIVREPFSDM